MKVKVNGFKPGKAVPKHGGRRLQVRNNTGMDLDALSVLKVADPLYPPDQDSRNVVFSGVVPTTPADFGRFVVTLTPLAQEAEGNALLEGVVPVKADITDIQHQYADVDWLGGTVTKLVSDWGGSARILWSENSPQTDEWAIVSLGRNLNSTVVVGNAQATINPGAGDGVLVAVKGATGFLEGDTIDDVYLSPDFQAVQAGKEAWAAYVFETGRFEIFSSPAAGGGGGGGYFGKVNQLAGLYDPLAGGALSSGTFYPVDINGLVDTENETPFYNYFSAAIEPGTFAMFMQATDGNFYIMNAIC
jgi:hypothetical protein